MSPRKTRTVPIEKSDYITYLERARQYVASAKEELGKGRPESVGLLAIHCAIASADALVVYEKGFRSAGESHFDATGCQSFCSPSPPCQSFSGSSWRVQLKNSIRRFD